MRSFTPAIASAIVASVSPAATNTGPESSNGPAGMPAASLADRIPGTTADSRYTTLWNT